MSLFRPGRIKELRGWDDKHQPEFGGGGLFLILAAVALIALIFA